MLPVSCPGCSSEKFTPEGKGAKCSGCGGFVAEHIYQGDSYAMVSWAMHSDPNSVTEPRYFDISGVGSDGPYRRHGWYDPATKRIVQAG